MKILHLSFFSPLPMHNGSQVREYSLVEPLLQENEVSLISFQEAIDQESVNALNALYSSVELLPLPRPKRGSVISELLRAANHIFSMRPPVSVDHFSTDMEQLVRRVCETDTFDVVYVDLVWMLEYLPNDLNLKTIVILNTHNAEYRALESFASGPSTSLFSIVSKAYFLFSSLKMKRYERLLLQKVNRVLAVSDDDKESLQLITNKPVDVIPNAVKVLPYTRSEESIQPHSIVFVGSMSYKPNVEAVVWFSKTVLPILQETYPHVVFTIVGANPDPEVKSLQRKHVIVTGTVPLIQPYLDQATCFVAPLFSGGGTNMKIIEAMASGIPVISTSKGLEGLAITPGTHVIKADNVEEFVNSVQQLFADRDR
ncbi:glycosyltransferase, partial [candidate division WWE3 bacterium]|nr:glycosyltransferase [candidate division WWE3 bacterium]